MYVHANVHLKTKYMYMYMYIETSIRHFSLLERGNIFRYLNRFFSTRAKINLFKSGIQKIKSVRPTTFFWRNLFSIFSILFIFYSYKNNKLYVSSGNRKS